MKIVVVGTGYVGLANAVLLAQKHEVTAVDIMPWKVEAINQRKSTIADRYIEEYLSKKELSLTAVLDGTCALAEADIIIIATPTDYNPVTNYFDTSSVEEMLAKATNLNESATIVIKSTVPIGYTMEVRQKYRNGNIIFSPEFLREGQALYDNLYPSRIIVGAPEEDKNAIMKAEEFGGLLSDAAIRENIPMIVINPTEAEAVKLFSNTYLALRIAYFNELDTYAELNGLDSKQIIDGVGLDPRIGGHYNNPSFGYGGYCLPKDTKQILANYGNTPNNIIGAIVKANDTRKRHIADMILKKNPKKIGIYRLAMKAKSDNFRQSAIWDIMQMFRDAGREIIVYEPTLKEQEFCGYQLQSNIDNFIAESDVIVANRISDELKKVKEKVYTRDLYGRD